jgi:hypothetical protein
MHRPAGGRRELTHHQPTLADLVEGRPCLNEIVGPCQAFALQLI